VILEITDDRIEWLANEPDVRLDLIREQVKQKVFLEKTTDKKQKKQTHINEKLERPSREARQILDLEITDARALKNRVHCRTIRDLLQLYLPFKRNGKLDKLKLAFKDCLMFKQKTV
jgi:hypothetical protein